MRQIYRITSKFFKAGTILDLLKQIRKLLEACKDIQFQFSQCIHAACSSTITGFKMPHILIMAFINRFYGVIGPLHFDGSVDTGADPTCCCHGSNYA